jgi:hypothetical protein
MYICIHVYITSPRKQCPTLLLAIYTHICVCVRVCIHVYMYKHIHIYQLFVQDRIHNFTEETMPHPSSSHIFRHQRLRHTTVHTFLFKHVCIYVCVYVCMHACILCAYVLLAIYSGTRGSDMPVSTHFCSYRCVFVICMYAYMHVFM